MGTQVDQGDFASFVSDNDINLDVTIGLTVRDEIIWSVFRTYLKGQNETNHPLVNAEYRVKV